VVGDPINEPGWWTLALEFDEKGVGHYYARRGVDVPTEKNRMFDTKRVATEGYAGSPLMDRMGYGFFTLPVPIDREMSPRFVIDDYEVWAVRCN